MEGTGVGSLAVAARFIVVAVTTVLYDSGVVSAMILLRVSFGIPPTKRRQLSTEETKPKYRPLRISKLLSSLMALLASARLKYVQNANPLLEPEKSIMRRNSRTQPLS